LVFTAVFLLNISLFATPSSVEECTATECSTVTNQSTGESITVSCTKRGPDCQTAQAMPILCADAAAKKAAKLIMSPPENP